MKLITQKLQKIENENVPIWLMRQAGRYLPEYRKLRANFDSFIDFCLNPEAATEATLQPLKRFDLDAAIIFSDILIIPHALGMHVEFKNEIGPILNPVFETKELRLDKQVVERVYQAIRKTKDSIDKNFPEKALIGFAGAPWTVACYMVEGKGSKDFATVRRFYYENKKEFLEIIELLVEVTSEYLIGQIESGVEIIKLFDSWAGLLPHDLFELLIIEPTQKIVLNIKKEHKNIPIIGFPKGAGIMNLDYARKTGVDCLAIDHSINIEWARDNIQKNIVIQGNLDNALLFASKNDIEKAAERVLNGFSNRPFIFNLGHGVLPGTPVENVDFLVRTVKNYRKNASDRTERTSK